MAFSVSQAKRFITHYSFIISISILSFVSDFLDMLYYAFLGHTVLITFYYLLYNNLTFFWHAI